MKHSIRKALLLAGFCLLGALSAAAQPFLRLPAIIGDHMVLQEKTTVRLHGWADPNATLTVTPSWGEAVTVKVGYDTAWSVELTTPAASAEPRSITFATNKKAVRKVDDILIGQVWLCSGQSNMNWSAANGIADMKKELESPMNPRIRLFTVTKNSTPYPQDDCEGRWQVCTPKSALYFSAVGYFFGKRLADELQQPVGLVNSSWGGTPVEVWTPANVMGKNAQMVASWKEQPKSKLWQIGSLYNAMIHPLRHTTFAGAIWYQGESNKTNAALYGDEFTMMIESWRKVFGRTLPFYFVQIAPHARAEGGTSGAVVREQQARVAATVPSTGMAVISDLVDDVTNIHPRYKQGVGDRLAGFALAEVYGKSGRKYKSPTFRQAEFRKSQVYVSFDNAEGGIVCKDDAIRGLEVCDASMKFVPAQGIIDDKNNRLVVWSKQVARPTAVRYCFSDGAIGNLFDTAGLPVAPFLSDADDKAAPARQPAESLSGAAVTASGKGFAVGSFRLGEKFFTNRVYPLTKLPERFAGYEMLIHDAGLGEQMLTCKVTAREKCRIYIAVRRNSHTADVLNGWKPERDDEIRYTTHDKSKPGILGIYYRDVKAGESVTLPRTKDFAGVTLLAPKIVYTK